MDSQKSMDDHIHFTMPKTIRIERKKASMKEQSHINDKKFKCSISGDIWKSKLFHDVKCLYKYCKTDKGW